MTPPLVSMRLSRSKSTPVDIFVFGGIIAFSGSASNVETYSWEGTRGVDGAFLFFHPSTVAASSAAGNSTQAFMFDGYVDSGSPQGRVEHYLFATPGTKGVTPANLHEGNTRQESASASSSTRAYVYGGVGSGMDGTSYFRKVEEYPFATPATKVTPSIFLSTDNSTASAASNADRAYVFGGVGWPYTKIENHLFATGVVTANAVSLVVGRLRSAAASNNSTLAAVFGGEGDSGLLDTVEVYGFAQPGTRGTSPAVLHQAKRQLAAAGKSDFALVIGGIGGTMTVNIEKYLFAAGVTKGTAPGVLSANRYALSAVGRK
jgi:hypothetical protein